MSADSSPPAAKCPSCFSQDWTECVGGDDSYKLFACTTCGCGRVLRIGGRPPEYDDFYSAGTARRLAGPFDTLWRLKRRSRAALIARFAPEGARICDVGCERGELLNALKETGCRVVGTQMSRPAAEYARRTFGIDVVLGELPDAPFAHDRFDAVLFLNVLEHLPDPDTYVRQAAQMLAPGGRVWVEVPNAGSFTAKLTRKNWLHHDPENHLWAFDVTTMTKLIERHGIEVEEIYAHSWEFAPIGCVQSWLNWLPGRKNVVFDVVRRGFSRQFRLVVEEVAHVILAGIALPAALAVSAIEGLRNNGQVVLIRGRRLAS